MRLEVLNIRGASLWVMRLCVALLLVVLSIGKSAAQVYPVQATVQLVPPYSLYLSDYVESGTERLVLNVFLADVARPQLDVRFRLKIIGQGITIQTRDGYMPPPVSIQGGMPLRLISTDLADYFNPNNLIFQGLSRAEYERVGKLPEGVYQICFEVLEYNRGIKVSNTACGVAWMILNDPPIVNLPRQNEKLKAMSPQNVILQWTPRHMGSPNSAFTTEYDVTMVEVWPATRNPNDAILTSPPIFETTTMASTIVYGPAETPLEPGRRYAFRVKARSIAGITQLDLFKNNGYSEVFSFVYGDACDLPTGISTTAINTTRFSVGWESLFNQTAYRVRYREAGSPNWYDNNVAINSIEIGSLKPGTVYEYQVAATCGFYDGQYSPVTKVTTAPAPETVYSCGIPLDVLKLDPTLYTGSLNVGDIIMAGDFDVKVTKITGRNGTYSGEGVIEVPYFNKAKVKTEFSSITVNKDLRMINGYMNVTGAAVDVIPQGVTDFMDKLDEALDAADSALNKIESGLSESFDPNSFVPDTVINVKGGIADVRKNENGSVTVYDKNGGSQTIPAGTSAAIKDDNGNGYLVDKKGNIHKTTADVAAKAGNRQYNLMLRFTPAAQAHYGFDEEKYAGIPGYEKIENYPVPWKAVASNGTDVVSATLTGAADMDTRKIHFEQGGVTIPASPIDKTQSASVTLSGKSDGTEEGLLAIYAPSDTGKVQVLGKLKVVAYDEIQHTVVIVPVNGTKYPYNINTLRDTLNSIYGQAVVKWSVELAEPVTVTLPATFEDGGTGIFSNYTSDMKTVISAYADNMDDDKLYLFLIGGKSSSGVLGYMPRNKQSGFIFVDQTGIEKQTIRTIAHELGHGAFNLPHIFEEERFTISKKSTDNLMDYNGGQKLYKYQWDKMRYPDIVIGVFEEDADAQEVVVMNIEELAGWEYNNVAYAFLAPSGQVVLVPKSVKSLEFSTGDVTSSKDENVLTIHPFGTLLSFNIGGVVYRSVWGATTHRFLGYKAGDKRYVIKENIPAEKLSAALNKVIIGIPQFKEGGFVYRMQLIDNVFGTIGEVTADEYFSGKDFQRYDFLNKYFASTDNIKILSAPPSFFDNPKAVDFVKYYRDKANGQTEAYDLYLYTHATLLDRYELLGNCFSTGLPGQFLHNIASFKYLVTHLSIVDGVDNTIDEEKMKFPADFELKNSNSPGVSYTDPKPEEVFKYLMSKWSDVDINYYKGLSNLVTEFRSMKISPDEGAQSKTGDLLDEFGKYRDLDTDNFDCVYAALTTENKRNLLRRLVLSNDDDIWNAYEKIILKIMDNLVSDAEVQAIFQDFKDHPDYLHNAYDKLDNLANGEYIMTFMRGVFDGWKETVTYTGDKYPQFANFEKATPEEKARMLKELVDDPKVILLENEKLFTGTASDDILHSQWNSTNNKIEITQTNDYINNYGRVLINAVTLSSIGNAINSTASGKDLGELDPFAPVVIFISMHEVEDLGLRLDPGIYAVPAMLVYWVYKTKMSDVNKFYLRMGLDALAIALAPLTGGASVGMITLEIAIPAADMLITATNEEFGKDSPAVHEAFEYWDKAYTAYGVVLGGVGLMKAAPAIGTGIAAGTRRVVRLVVEPRLAGELIWAKTVTKAKELANFSPEDFANYIDKVADGIEAGVKTYGASWANYAGELRRLSGSIRANLLLRYVSLYKRLECFIDPNGSLLLSNSQRTSFVSLFKYEMRAGTQYATDLRLLRDFNNVKRVRFAGELESVVYLDKGNEVTGVFFVEDLDNPGSFFVVTEDELKNGISGIDNYDDVAKEYKEFKNIDESPTSASPEAAAAAIARARWQAMLNELKSKYPNLWNRVKDWDDVVLQDRFVTHFENQVEALTGLNKDTDLVSVWEDLGTLISTDARDIEFLSNLKNIKNNGSNVWGKVKAWEDVALLKKFASQINDAKIVASLNGSAKLDDMLALWRDVDANYSVVSSAFKEFSAEQKIRFFNEFGNEKIRAALPALNSEPVLVKAWETVIVTGEKIETKEFIQTLRFGREHGGGSINFPDSERGVEGVFITQKGEYLPLSLKESPSPNPKQVFRLINRNSEQIINAEANSIAKRYCKFGPDANTYMRIDVTNVTKEQVLAEFHGVEVARQRLKFGDSEIDVYREIKIVFNDGSELIFINYKLQ